ncbi:MAG: DUF2844 domain-containing protein [Proteobacteria bacterium]|nr:DUF2844 domain-containing protein [Pseudomonadota bacterium]
MDRTQSRRRAALASAAAAVLLASAPLDAAVAGLGENAATIARDHSALHGRTLTVTSTVQYEVHESISGDGTRVREFAVPGGAVFAVRFEGRHLPDLGVLLASHYDEYLAAARSHRGGHHHFAISTPSLALEIVRAPRGFTGSARLPGALPAGVSPQELR